MPVSSQRITLPAQSLSLSQTKYFLNNHIAQVPIISNKQGITEMRDEIISSVGRRDIDTRCPIGKILSFTWGILTWTWMPSSIQAKKLLSALHLSTTFRWVQWLKIPFWLTKKKTWQTLFLLQQLQSLRDQPTQLCWWVVTLWDKNRKVPDKNYRNSFEYFISILLCMHFNLNYS